MNIDSGRESVYRCFSWLDMSLELGWRKSIAVTVAVIFGWIFHLLGAIKTDRSIAIKWQFWSLCGELFLCFYGASGSLVDGDPIARWFLCRCSIGSIFTDCRGLTISICLMYCWLLDSKARESCCAISSGLEHFY